MKWFLDITTRAKLFTGFGAIILLLVIVVMAAYNGISGIERSQRDLFEHEFATAVRIREIRSNQNGIREATMMMILTNDPAVRSLKRQEVKDRGDEIEKDVEATAAALKNDPALFPKVEKYDELRKAYRETRDRQTIPLIMAGKTDEAKKLVLGIQSERNQQMRAIADNLVDDLFKATREHLRLSEERAAKLVAIFTAISGMAIFLGFASAIALGRIIANPLKKLSGIAERIAAGDLSVSAPTEDRNDEIGALMQTFRKMTDNLREMNRDLQDGINVLASSTSEILSSTTQVASGMSETATSVSETTATVEEVKQTALLASEKSKGVSENAQRAAQVAQQGTAAVSATVEGINHIRVLMETVAEGLVRLSEQTQSIGEIIAAVNDLAQQSNLLAVNAAIEAAKAGEQGKGFTVVAQEIKSLADQSKQSTEQVRAILTDIQKATSAAVMSAEQVSKAVDAGVKQADESGVSITNLAESLAEAAQSATQIAASSQQQLVGMEQVVQAMENIKLATQQNVAGTKQAEQAAHNLNELGQKLKVMVGRYKVA